MLVAVGFEQPVALQVAEPLVLIGGDGKGRI
jgi:hypothetical protein